MAPSEKQPAPEGTRPLMISMREMDTLGLKTGSGLRETVPYKVFSKAEILTQISQIGFMCPFHEFRNEIAKLQGEELLIVADPQEVYGENWLLCITRKAYEIQMEALLQRGREQQEALAAQEKASTNEEDDLSKIVYEDRPMVARAWVSTTAKDTFDDVDALNIRSTRQLIKISVTKMSDELNADYKFSDRDADQIGFVEWRQHKDPNYELTRLEQDVGLQGIPELVDNSTQTSWFRSVNSALQYEPIRMEAKRRQDELDSDKLQVFLDKVLPLVEEALQQNETLDVFLDPFANLFEEDGTSGGGAANKNENAIKELRSFTDLVYSKNKTLPAIDWHPKKNGVVAVAATANVNFSKRLDLLDKTDSSYILVWNFVDLIHPQLMLEAPQDVLALRFNPTMPHIVAGGLYNGQVLVWDYSKAEHLMSKGKSKASSAKSSSSGNNNANDDAPKQIPPVKPLYVSYLDSSHRRSVADLLWLPPGMEVNNRGHIVASGDNMTNQFVTVASDGQVCFWDLRFKDPKYRGLTRIKVDKSSAAKDAVPEVHFTPIYSIALTKVETTGELGLRSICLERPKDDNAAAAPAAGSGSSRFYCATEEGELVYADWRPHAATASTNKAASSINSHDDGGGDDGVEYVQWLCHDHYRATIAVRASPFFPSILLTASETNFHLWNVSQVNKASEGNGPIFSSPLSLSALTCAAFSPTRPGVIYIGRADGMLEVWDFMDQSHRASLTVGITACALTSVEFRPVHSAGAPTGAAGTTAVSGKPGGAALGAPSVAGGTVATQNVKQQVVAIGDQIGNLHIMEIPRTLARASSGERQAMESYFKRESERMKATWDAMTEQQTTQGGGSRMGRDEYGGGSAGAPPKTASGDAKPTTTVSVNATAAVDEFFKLMETDFLRELGIESTTVA